MSNWRNIIKADDPEGFEEDVFDPSGSTHGRIEQKPKPKKPSKDRFGHDDDNDDGDGDTFIATRDKGNISQPPGSCDGHPACSKMAEFFCRDCCSKFCAECYENFGGPGSGGRGHPRVKMAGDPSKKGGGWHGDYDGSPHTEWCNQKSIDERKRKERGL